MLVTFKRCLHCLSRTCPNPRHFFFSAFCRISPRILSECQSRLVEFVSTASVAVFSGLFHRSLAVAPGCSFPMLAGDASGRGTRIGSAACTAVSFRTRPTEPALLSASKVKLTFADCFRPHGSVASTSIISQHRSPVSDEVSLHAPEISPVTGSKSRPGRSGAPAPACARRRSRP